MALRLVVFDLDGTLVDSRDAIVACTATALMGQGLPVPDRERILSLIGLPLQGMLKTLAPEARIPDLVQRYRKAFPDLDRRHSRPHGPAITTVIELRERGVATAIASSKNLGGIERVLEEAKLLGQFDMLVGDDVVANPKPAPDMVERILDQLGVDPAEAAVVGDTTWDIQMGRTAGVRTVGVGWGAHSAPKLRMTGADAVVEAYEELDAILMGWL